MSGGAPISRRVAPCGRLEGRVSVPGDKSITHRAILFGAIAEGASRISGHLRGEDNLRTLEAVRAMGVRSREEEGRLVVEGAGLRGLREPEDVLYMGNSGTTTRLIAGLLAAQPFFSVLAGDRYLNRRPMKRVAEPLRAMGAAISGREGGNYPPLAIWGGKLHGITYELPVLSAQVKSAVLIAGLFAEGDTAVLEREATRDHTERMLRAMGAHVDAKDTQQGRWVRIEPARRLAPLDLSVPGDISSAAFFLVAGLLVPRSDIRVDGVGTNATRTGVLDALRAMGGRVEDVEGREVSGEPVGDLIVQTSKLRATTVGGALVPRLIDEIPILAVAATQAEGVTVVRDAEELRVKESDRIAAVAEELGKMGARIVQRPDGMEIEGPTRLRGARVSSRGDHRIAMSLAVAALVAEGETEIEDVENVATSFPGFWELLDSLRAE